MGNHTRCKDVYAGVQPRKDLRSNETFTVVHVDLSDSICRGGW